MLRGVIVVLLVIGAVRAEDVAYGDISNPPLTPGLLVPLWPTMRTHLPVGFASVQWAAVAATMRAAIAAAEA